MVCESLTFSRTYSDRPLILPALLTSAWESPDGRRAQILVNPTRETKAYHVRDQWVSIPPMDARLVTL